MMIEHLKVIHKKLGGLNSKVIHIAGSKGKGSTAFLLAEAIFRSGFKVGLFNSPALFCNEEMILVNMAKIETNKLKGLIKRVEETAGNKKISWFEKITLAALLYFEEEKCDYVVLETGIGGKNDSTNIVDEKILTILTHIELEHTDILGDSLEKITREKMGICRKNVPLITSVSQHKNVMDEIIKSGFEPVLASSFDLGNHHPESAGLAIYALDMLGIPFNNEMKEKLETLQIAGRFEIVNFGQHVFVLDGSHTYDSIQWLHAKVFNFQIEKALPDPLWVIHFLKDKPKDLIKLFIKKNSVWMDIENDRASNSPDYFSHGSAEMILEDIKNSETPKFVVFTGSFRVVAEIKKLLGEKPVECIFI